MKKRTKFVSVILLMALASCAAYATIVIYKELTSSITILAEYGIEVLDTDQVTPLTSVDFGSHFRGETFEIPAQLAPNPKYWLKNTGEAEFWIGMEVTDWPSDVEMWIEGPLFGALHPGEIKGPLAPGAITDFYFYVIVGAAAPFGSYTPTIIFNAHDSPTG